MSELSPVAAAGVALLASAGLAGWLQGPYAPLRLLDHANARSLHVGAVPRSGGLAVAGGLLVAWAPGLLGAGATDTAFWLACGAALVLAVGLWDDCGHVPALPRLLVHLAAAVLLFRGGLWLDTGLLPGLAWAPPCWAVMGLTALFVAWSVNLYNFMDGMDGLAGGMAVIGFGALGLMGLFQGATGFAAITLGAAAAALGFLLWNAPPARIFLGDGGSGLLGFLMAACSLWGVTLDLFELWQALLVFSPFWADASSTLLRRLWRGEAVWRPHRKHLYQRLVRAGWGHQRTAFAAWGLMLACALSAMGAGMVGAAAQWLVLGGWTLFYLWLIRFTDARMPFDLA